MAMTTFWGRPRLQHQPQVGAGTVQRWRRGMWRPGDTVHVRVTDKRGGGANLFGNDSDDGEARAAEAKAAPVKQAPAPAPAPAKVPPPLSGRARPERACNLLRWVRVGVGHQIALCR